MVDFGSFSFYDKGVQCFMILYKVYFGEHQTNYDSLGFYFYLNQNI